MSFLTELRRRNVVRMAGLYLVGAWLITQVADTVLPMFGAPGWLPRSIVILLAIGFIPALVFAWVFELTPEGLKRDADVKPEESIAAQTARRMEHMIVVVLLLAVGYFCFDKFALAPRRDAALVSATARTIKAETGATRKAPINEKSIAVLPFANMSADRENEYFSDGIAEEILNALAHVDDLKVAGRTSSFYFKGRNESLATIGETLGVAHVLEGSVRKQGDKVRITAQLIRVQDGFHQWSETYDGDLKDVFALQERIAQAITEKLQVTLSGKQAQQLVNAGTDNPDAYSLYLQATAIFNHRDGPRFADAVRQLEQAIALDPGFARAHSRLAALYAIYGNYNTADFDRAMKSVDEHARRASALDPGLAEPHAALALANSGRRQYLQARANFKRALAIDPDDVTTGFWYATDLIVTGYVREGSAQLDRVLQLDPMLPNALLWRGIQAVFDGDLAGGERLLLRARDAGHVFVGLGFRSLHAARGEHAAAVAALTAGMLYFTQAFPASVRPIFAAAVHGDAKAKQEALRIIDAHLATRPRRVAGVAPYVLVRSGEVRRGLRLMQQAPTSNDAMLMSELFGDRSLSAITAPEFPEFARKTGLAALWDVHGPPDRCRRQPSGDYTCK